MKTFCDYLIENPIVITKLPEIYLDMDETIVDWMSAANKALQQADLPEWTSSEWKKYSDEDADKIRWGAINKIPTFWENLHFSYEGKKIWNFVKKYKPNILSACGPLAQNCAVGKKKWLSKNLGMSNLNQIHFVRRSEKRNFAKIKGVSGVLIDDYMKNCEEFVAAGGFAIQATTANDVIIRLKRLGFN